MARLSRRQTDAAAEKSGDTLVGLAIRDEASGFGSRAVVAPGHPERSTLLTRLSRRGTNTGQMPQLATSLVDHQAVELFREWIASLPNAKDK